MSNTIMGTRTLNGKRRERLMRNELEDNGIITSRKSTVKEVEGLYRTKLHKTPPSYSNKISLWLRTDIKKKDR